MKLDIYVHSSKESAYFACIEAGLSEEATSKADAMDRALSRMFEGQIVHVYYKNQYIGLINRTYKVHYAPLLVGAYSTNFNYKRNL